MSESPTSNPNLDLRELRRSRDNRVVAGVLGGLGGRFGIDPLLLRIVTVVLALFGGVGIVLYALGWLLIPDQDAETSIGEQALGRDESRPAGMSTVALAAGLVFAALLATGGMFGSGTGWLLMILTLVGAYALLRRQDGDGDGESAPEIPSGIDYPGFPGYVPAPAEAPATADRGDQTAAEPGAVTEPAAPTVPASSIPAAAAPPSAVSGTVTGEPAETPGSTSDTQWPDGPGWPEGPDWSPPPPGGDMAPVASPPPDVERSRSRLGLLTLSAVVVALGILAINDATWASIPRSAYVATALAVVGIGLLIGTWFGRARGLIGFGIVLALVLPVSVVADGLNLESVGSVNVQPQSIEALPDGPQEYGAGSVVYDLSLLELEDSDSFSLDIKQGVGELRVIVPPEADVMLNAEVGLGAIESFDGRSGGPGSSRQDTDLGEDGAGGGEITLNLELGVGRVEVRR